MATSVVFENNEIINFEVYNRINEKYFLCFKRNPLNTICNKKDNSKKLKGNSYGQGWYA